MAVADSQESELTAVAGQLAEVVEGKTSEAAEPEPVWVLE